VDFSWGIQNNFSRGAKVVKFILPMSNFKIQGALAVCFAAIVNFCVPTKESYTSDFYGFDSIISRTLRKDVNAVLLQSPDEPNDLTRGISVPCESSVNKRTRTTHHTK